MLTILTIHQSELVKNAISHSLLNLPHTTHECCVPYDDARVLSYIERLKPQLIFMGKHFDTDSTNIILSKIDYLCNKQFNLGTHVYLLAANTNEFNYLKSNIDEYYNGIIHLDTMNQEIENAFNIRKQALNKSDTSDTKATNQELILKLSDRQLDVIDFILQGKQVKEISSILNLSIGTIRKHISNIHQILKISKTKQLHELFSSKKFTDSNF